MGRAITLLALAVAAVAAPAAPSQPFDVGHDHFGPSTDNHNNNHTHTAAAVGAGAADTGSSPAGDGHAALSPPLLLAALGGGMLEPTTFGPNDTFPAGFVFGVATSAFQIEGDGGDRPRSVWDVFAVGQLHSITTPRLPRPCFQFS